MNDPTQIKFKTGAHFAEFVSQNDQILKALSKTMSGVFLEYINDGFHLNLEFIGCTSKPFVTIIDYNNNEEYYSTPFLEWYRENIEIFLSVIPDCCGDKSSGNEEHLLEIKKGLDLFNRSITKITQEAITEIDERLKK